MLSAQRIGRAGLGRLESFAEQTLKVARLAERDQPVGAENLRDQAIFVNYAPRRDRAAGSGTDPDP